MVETATKQRALVTDYVNDPDFIAMPYALKLDTLIKALKTDYELQRLDDENQQEVLDFVLSQAVRGARAPTPSPDETAQTTFTEAPLLPPNQDAVQPASGPDTRAAAIADLPAPVRMGVQALTSAADLPGMIPQIAGLYTRGVQAAVRPVEQAITGGDTVTQGLERYAQAFERPGVQRPATTALVGERGFYPEESNILRNLQHVLNTTAQGATGGLLFGAAAAARAPLTPEVVRGAYLAAQGAVAGNVVKDAGAGPWVQAATELVAGGLSPNEVRDLYAYLAARPGLQKRLANVVRRVPTYREKLDEFGAIREVVPDIQGDLATQTASPQLESTRRSLIQRNPAAHVPFAQRAESDIAALSRETAARLPDPNPEIVRDVLDRAANPVVELKRIARQAKSDARTARENAAEITRQTKPLLDDIRTRTTTKLDELAERRRVVEQGLDDAVRQRTEALQQLDAERHLLTRAQLIERRRLADDKLAQERDFRDQLAGIRREHDVAVKQADDAVQAVADATRVTSREATRTLRLAEGARDKATTDITALTAAAKNNLTLAVRETTPEELVRAANGDELAIAKLERFEQNGDQVRQVYERARQRLKRDANSAENYGDPAFFTTKANPERLEGHLAQFEQRMQETMREQYVPDAAVDNMRAVIRDKGKDLSLYDLHNMRSELLDEIRHTAPGSRRDGALKKLFYTVDAEMDTVAKPVPGLRDKYDALSNWYRQEIQRFTSAGGSLAVRVDPVTGNPLYQSADLAQRAFAPGPSLGRVSGERARNLQNFRSYMRDLDAFESSELLKGDKADTAFLADVRGARDAIVDIAKTEFYTAAVDSTSGILDPKKANGWLREHATLIQESPTLQRYFSGPKERLATIRELEDRAHQVAVLHGDDVDEARRIQQLLREEGQDTALGTEFEARAQRANAQETRDFRELNLQNERDIAAQSQTLAQRELEDTALAQADEAFAARQALQGAQRRRAIGRRDIANVTRAESQAAKATGVAEEAPLRTAQAKSAEHAAFAAKQARLAKANIDDAVRDYDAFFGSGAAARAERQAGVAHETLGLRPEDKIAEIESMQPRERLRAYEGLFRVAKDDPDTVQAVLGAMWRHHLSETGTRAEMLPGQPILPDASQARKFLVKNESLFEQYLPQYAKDLDYIAKGFERYERLANPTAPVPRELAGASFGRDITLAAGFAFVTRALGYGYMESMTVGKLAFMGERFMNAINVHTLTNMYLDPQTTGVMRRILDPDTSPVWRQTMLHNLALRSGALASTATEPQ